MKYLIKGIKRGEASCPIEVNLLFTIGREVDPDEAVRLVNVADQCDRDYVVGIGLACDEANNPPEKHTAAFRKAREAGFKTTAHAGEWVSEKGNWFSDFAALKKNIRTTLYDLRVDRIGHAITLAYDREALSHVIDNGIGVEGCPASNFAGGCIPSFAHLRIRDLLNAGVIYSLNHDDDLFLPDLQSTFELCDSEYHFTDEEVKKMTKNAWESRFGRRAASGI